ncbi:hypothetical protein M885DRAFT_450534, partial [Pelagophyceae sp. CCMP2097]
RKGKWTVEEESYTTAVIREFERGMLSCAPGTTLRSFLSEQLNCDPMRITKKFAGDASIGKRVFAPCKCVFVRQSVTQAAKGHTPRWTGDGLLALSY